MLPILVFLVRHYILLTSYDLSLNMRKRTFGHVGTVKKISLCGQRRLRSYCADAQADLSLRWSHISEGMFSHVADNISYLFKAIMSFTSL